MQIYDSLSTPLGEKVQGQLVALSEKFVDNATLIIEKINVQKQKGGNDCGLFAIAFATALAFGQSPWDHSYIQESMREHLLKCFKNNRMRPFP